MCWATEPSTPPAKRSATKRLSSDYGERLCQRLSGTHRLIGVPSRTRAKTEQKNRPEMRPEFGSHPGGSFWGCWDVPWWVSVQSARRQTRTAAQGTLDERRTCGNTFTLSDVCRTIKPLKTPCSGIVSGAVHSAGIAGTAQVYPRCARTGADGARGCRAYIRTGARLCGALGGSWGDLGRPAAIRHRKNPGRIRGGGLFEAARRAEKRCQRQQEQEQNGHAITSNAIVSHLRGVVKRVRERPTTRGGGNDRGAAHRCTTARAGHHCRYS